MNLSYGSQGEEVRKLQEALNKQGYNLSVDGIFGINTQNAVRDYQSKNNLSVDGIAGANTTGKLYGTTENTQETTTTYEPDYGKYKYDPSEDTAYADALKKLQEAQAAAPVYNATYDQQLNDIYEKYMNRDKFTYDINSDALYQQYKEQYQNLGKKAMQDTMGQAAALTGGYGSTYSEAVGQQQYNAYLQQLNDIVPDLYGQAYNAYTEEGNQMLQNYNMLSDLRNQEYNKYSDDYNRYLQALQNAREDAETAYNRGYNDYLNSMNIYLQDQERAYSEAETLLSNGIMPSDDHLNRAGMDKNYAQQLYNAYMAQLAAASSGGSSGGGGGYSSGGSRSSEDEELNFGPINTYQNGLPPSSYSYVASEKDDDKRYESIRQNIVQSAITKGVSFAAEELTRYEDVLEAGQYESIKDYLLRLL